MAGKRHHYLPQFLLRRFARTEGEDAGRLWRADLSGERLVRVAPKHEAAKRHYYKLPEEIEIPGLPVEDLLQVIESGASMAVIKFERGETPSLDDRHMLALFLLLQHRRTPAGRRELRFMDELVAKLDLEFRFGDTALARSALTVNGVEPSQEVVARWQRESLEKLRDGRIVVESSADREVALMFQHLDEIAPMLVDEFDWRFIRIPTGAGEVVLPDVGVTMYDPTPKFPQSGTGLKSSPNSETILHLAPNLVLLLRPGEGNGDVQEASAEQVERLNLRAFACSDQCVYGRTRELVTQVLSAAAADPERVGTLKPRAPTLWIAEGEGEPTVGPTSFTGLSLDGTKTQELYLTPEGIEEARKHVVRLRD